MVRVMKRTHVDTPALPSELPSALSTSELSVAGAGLNGGVTGHSSLAPFFLSEARPAAQYRPKEGAARKKKKKKVLWVTLSFAGEMYCIAKGGRRSAW